MLAIQNFQQRLYAHYKAGLSLPPTYSYLYGNPVQPLVPVETAQQGVCIIGAYPPARLATAGPEREVPVGDPERPFSAEPYFDGSRVRAVSSGETLAEAYLAPLGLRREQGWLTYLVKIFLFKDEHLAKYRRLGCAWPEWETHSRFETLARQSLDWLEEELALARPRLVITLGAEVAGVLQDVPGIERKGTLLGGHVQDIWLGETVYPALHLAAPHEVLRPNSEAYRLHWQAHLPEAQEIVGRLVATAWRATA
jgi:uracil-DNA glycosylase